jgi:general stress protein YciG
MAGNNERGFAAMDPESQRQIASKGGKAAHEKGTAHEFSSEEAAEAGRKGGRSVSRNREHMAAIGRKGGLAAHRRTAEEE